MHTLRQVLRGLRDFSTANYNTKRSNTSPRPTSCLRGRYFITASICIALCTILSCPGVCGQVHYDTILEQLRGLSSDKRVTLCNIGASVEQRPIYAVTITNPQPSNDSKRVRVLILCGQHGDEQEPIYAMLSLMDSLLRSKDDADALILDSAIVTVVPVVNPDGFVVSQRHNKRGVDLNRNWSSPNQPETIAVTGLMNHVQPHVLIDEHEWVKDDPYQPDCIEVPRFGDRPEHQLARLLAKSSADSVIEQRFALPTVYYSANCDTRLAHRWFANGGICSLLIETTPSRPNENRRQAYEDVTMAVLSALVSNDDTEIAHELGLLLDRKPSNNGWTDMANGSTSDAATNKPATGELIVYLILAVSVGFLVYKSKRSRKGFCLEQTAIADVRLHTQRSFTLTDAVQSDLSIRTRLEIIHKYRTRPSDRQKIDRKHTGVFSK